MEEGLGPGVWAAVRELSQEEGGEQACSLWWLWAVLGKVTFKSNALQYLRYSLKK